MPGDWDELRVAQEPSAIKGAPDDRLQRLLVRGIFHLAHISPRPVCFKREELFLE